MSSFTATQVKGSTADNPICRLTENESCQTVFNIINSAPAIHLLAHFRSDTLSNVSDKIIS